jgi:hypothetical protein
MNDCVNRTLGLLADEVQNEAREILHARQDRLRTDIARAVDRFFDSEREDEYYKQSYGQDSLRYNVNQDLVRATLRGNAVPEEIVDRFEKTIIRRVLEASKPKVEESEASE